MRTYAEVDAVIAACVKAAGSALFTEWAGAPARYFYIPGDPPFECFQISVRLPENGRTAVTAWAVDTNDDTDDQMDRTWEGSVAQFRELLATAVATVARWKDREREKPDPPSPW